MQHPRDPEGPFVIEQRMTASRLTDTDSTPTLAQVAAHAGVSPITVSRVVRLPDMVAAATRERVEAAMRALGYVPNLVAGSLASARTRTVGVLVPTVANAIFADTIQGISDALEPSATRCSSRSPGTTMPARRKCWRRCWDAGRKR